MHSFQISLTSIRLVIDISRQELALVISQVIPQSNPLMHDIIGYPLMSDFRTSWIDWARNSRMDLEAADKYVIRDGTPL